MSAEQAVSLMVVETPIHSNTVDNGTLNNTEHTIPVEVVDNLNEEIIEELAKQVQAAAANAAANEQQTQETAVEQTLVDSAMQAVNQDVNTPVHNNATTTTEELIEDDRHIEITIGDPVAEKVIDSCVGTVCFFLYIIPYKFKFKTMEIKHVYQLEDVPVNNQDFHF